MSGDSDRDQCHAYWRMERNFVPHHRKQALRPHAFSLSEYIGHSQQLIGTDGNDSWIIFRWVARFSHAPRIRHSYFQEWRVSWGEVIGDVTNMWREWTTHSAELETHLKKSRITIGASDSALWPMPCRKKTDCLSNIRPDIAGSHP
jgi:hypothetical protein